MSCFFYIHRDLSGVENVYKVGKTILPHSAVRMRQRFCWNTFALDYLWFGTSQHIEALERRVKWQFSLRSRAHQKGFGEEMLMMPINELLDFIDRTIDVCKLRVVRIPMDRPYSATASKNCPLNTPGESSWDWYANSKIRDLWHNNSGPLTEDYLKKVFYGTRTSS